MKKIIKELNRVMRFYLRYRVIITNDIIEVKITPKSNNEEEINWVFPNDKDGKRDLFYSLQKVQSTKIVQ